MSAVYTDLLVTLRHAVGFPTEFEVNDRRLLNFLNSALLWLAGELQYNVTETTQALTANDYDYSLGVGVAEVLWVKHGTKTLEPSSRALWLRDGKDWLNSTAGQPEEYAYEAGTLYLYPEPDSTADDTALTYAYLPSLPSIETDTTQLPGSTSATPLLPSGAQGLLVWQAAVEFFKSTITPENAGMRGLQIQAAQAEVDKRLPNVKRQVMHAARGRGVQPKVFSRYRGAAR
jgi:hypothetical protein